MVIRISPQQPHNLSIISFYHYLRKIYLSKPQERANQLSALIDVLRNTEKYPAWLKLWREHPFLEAANDPHDDVLNSAGLYLRDDAARINVLNFLSDVYKTPMEPMHPGFSSRAFPTCR